MFENNDILLNYCNIPSDNIRYNHIKKALSKKASDEIPDMEKLIDPLNGYYDFVFVRNRGDYIDYYEGFVKSCWDVFKQKKEYKNLTYIDIVDKLVKERLSKIGKDLGLYIDNYDFKNNILHVIFVKDDGLKLSKINEEILKERYLTMVVLTEKSRKKLLDFVDDIYDLDEYVKNGWKLIAHHMTISFGLPIPEEVKNDFDKVIKLKVVGVGKSDKAMAVKVSGYYSMNENPHVTIAVNEKNGGKPVMSNYIKDWINVNGPIIEGFIEAIKLK